MNEPVKNTFAVGIVLDACIKQFERNHALAQLMRNFDNYSPQKPLSKYERFKMRVNDILGRIHDAWLVLIGKAEIQDDYYY